MMRGKGGAFDRAVAPVSHAVADFDVAKMRNLSRPAVGIHRIAKAVAADTGVRMNLAIFADFARRTHKNMRVQDAARADPCRTFDNTVRADQAPIAHIRSCANHTAGSHDRTLADRSVSMHAPL